MKVVINKCYGGYGLSDKAVQAIAARKGVTLYGKMEGFLSTAMYYTDPSLSDESFFLPDEDWHRADPDVVAVVESLGPLANDSCASLHVVDVPDDVQWHIEEYDGFETIHEDHQVWG